MTSHQRRVRLQPPACTTAQKVQLTHKLFLLENARHSLNEELNNFTNKAYEDVQNFLNASFPFTVFSDLLMALDAKSQAIDKLSALLKDLTLEPQVCVQRAGENGMKTFCLPLKDKTVLMTDVIKFGPLLQNTLMASSIAKAVQVVGATLSFQQLKHFLIPQASVVQEQCDMICCLSSSHDSSEHKTTPSFHLKAEEETAATAVSSEEKCLPNAVMLPPAIIDAHKSVTENTPLLPPFKTTLPENGNVKPLHTILLTEWGQSGEVQVPHQKQSSIQLLSLIRTKAKSMNSLDVAVVKHRNASMYTSGSSQPASPNIEAQSYQFKHELADEAVDALAPKTLLSDAENQGPVFRVKRVESSGSMTYTCVIASQTELWDVGDIVTETGQGYSETSSLESEDSQNIVKSSCENTQWKTKSVTNPQHESSCVGSKTQAINHVTIPKFQNRRFDEIEVVVSHIVSPGSFYIQHADSNTKLQALVIDSWKPSSSYTEQNCIPDIGTQVMAWFPQHEEWCRSQVMKICGVSGGDNTSECTGSELSIKVEVKRLDYGDTSCLSLRNMKELTQEMAALPVQAIQVTLAHVMPVNGKHWSEEALGWFRAMVHNRTLYARLYPQGPKVTVDLFLERGQLGAMRRGASLSLRLTQNGHAKHDKLKTTGPMKRNTAQLEMKKQESKWEKYLISCYTQSRMQMPLLQ
ncbi:uncharacterized protein LOC115426841 [Sphaeramia orbicularis]|uniref:uncharacterized protein LOC115426841 n=1 Tax=Sphaeramia orbicularis TaxID=375764 RepID=UPI0011808330|nr:uncharacterized protein LOC115426841 [Sphaeramia orbicularis]